MKQQRRDNLNAGYHELQRAIKLVESCRAVGADYARHFASAITEQTKAAQRTVPTTSGIAFYLLKRPVQDHDAIIPAHMTPL